MFNKSSRPFPYKNGIAALYTFITFHSLLDQYGVHILHYAAERSKGTFSMIRYVCIQKHIMPCYKCTKIYGHRVNSTFLVVEFIDIILAIEN